jgi:hypothetical protein
MPWTISTAALTATSSGSQQRAKMLLPGLLEGYVRSVLRMVTMYLLPFTMSVLFEAKMGQDSYLNTLYHKNAKNGSH